MAEQTCPKHGVHESKKCPACVWIRKYTSFATYENGCPLCGLPLQSNGLLMWCDNDKCKMASTSHQPSWKRNLESDFAVATHSSAS
jgi:hypothetical protein